MTFSKNENKELSIKELQEDITKVLKAFDDVVNAELSRILYQFSLLV